ncbi:hypothetical protein [Promicromonospora sp. NFX87]|uniref:hypothetical protein n=1 Tax=Promicromonospora sp. NFX87 TaxID=3402691 RepID=UPI003AFAAD8C
MRTTQLRAGLAVANLLQPFPLIARPAPLGVALEVRVAQLTSLLKGPFGNEGAAFASRALNGAAALASECRRPREANRILRGHLAVYAGRDSLSVPAALSMLEPAADLARLYAVAGHPDLAVTCLTNLMYAVRAGTSVKLDRYVLPLDRVEGGPDELRLWHEVASARMLGDAVKILNMAAKWPEAADLVTMNGGPGSRLTEPRQAVIVPHLIGGGLASARRHLEQAQPTQEWETEIASCLSVLAAEPDDRADAAAVMIETFQRSAPAAHLAAYRARYGITVTRLAHTTGHQFASIARQAAAEAIAVGDGHAARELLRTVAGCLSRKDIATLERKVTRAGLRGGALTGHYLSRLRSTADRATTILRDSLQTAPR